MPLGTPESTGTDWGSISVAALSAVGPAMVVAVLGIGLPEIRASLELSEVGAGTLFSAIIQRFGWRGATATVGCIAGAIALIQWVRIREPARAPTAPSVAGARKPGVLNRNMVLLAVAQFFGGAVFWITSSWTPTFLRTAVNLTISEAGMVMAAWGATPILGAMVLGTLSDRVGRKRIILLGAFPGVLVVLAVYGWLVHPLALAAGICLLGLCKSPVPSLVVALAQDSAAGGRVGAASGLIMSMHYVAALTTPVAMAQLITWLDSMSLAMLLGSAIAFTVFGVLITSVRERA